MGAQVGATERLEANPDLPKGSLVCSWPRLQSITLTTLTQPRADGRKRKDKFWRNSLAVHPSVIKRHQQSLTRRIRNIETKSRLRTLVKKARQAIDAKNFENAQMQIREVNKALAKAVSKGIIKNNTASRWLSRLSRGAAKSSSIG